MLVVVKAYPNPSNKYLESSCVAGIRTDIQPPEWVRLYPSPLSDVGVGQALQEVSISSL